jgi:hypothetical protein
LSVEDLTVAAVGTTPVTLTTNYVYGDANWPDRPTSITIDSIANPAGTRLETLACDTTTGQVLTRTETGWISATQSETHTTTTALYNGSEERRSIRAARSTRAGSRWRTLAQPVGLRKQVDGPRTDVSDLTTFVYYPFDASVTAGWRGRLAAVRDGAREAVPRRGFMYAFFFVIELIGSLVAFQLDRENKKMLVWLFWQRFLYRQLMYAVLIKSVTTALSGMRTGWGSWNGRGRSRSSTFSLRPSRTRPSATDGRIHAIGDRVNVSGDRMNAFPDRLEHDPRSHECVPRSRECVLG